MGSDCNLQLCLLPAGIEANVPSPDSVNTRSEESAEKLTIFYKGRVSVCNVTEYQAGVILRLAEKEMEKRTETTCSTVSPSESLAEREMDKRRKTCRAVFPSPSQLPDIHSRSSEPEAEASSALSVKRSLQRFLQKRMSRIHSTSPYSH